MRAVARRFKRGVRGSVPLTIDENKKPVLPRDRVRHAHDPKQYEERTIDWLKSNSLEHLIDMVRNLGVSMHEFGMMQRSRNTILGSELAIALIEIFHTADYNSNWELSFDEVVRFNMFLDSSSSLLRVMDDTKLLFLLADVDTDGYITIQEWLQAWTRTAKRLGNAHFIEKFVRQFRERKVCTLQLVQAWQFTTRVLTRILRWSRRYSQRSTTKSEADSSAFPLLEQELKRLQRDRAQRGGE